MCVLVIVALVVSKWFVSFFSRTAARLTSYPKLDEGRHKSHAAGIPATNSSTVANLCSSVLFWKLDASSSGTWYL